MSASRVIVVMSGTTAGPVMRELLDKRGIVRDTHYLFYQSFSSDVLRHLRDNAGIPMLLFIEHFLDSNALTGAGLARQANSQAIVVAFAERRLVTYRTCLDGSLVFLQLQPDDLSTIVHNFLAGATREEMSHLVEEIAREQEAKG